MKSKKARELIEKYAVGSSRDAAPSLLKRTAILCVELAEQEAESRMRDKAIQAYCSECSCYETGACALDPDKCATKLLFIEKLTEK